MIRVLGFGMGPQHLTMEVVDALQGCDYVIAAAKRSEHGSDELLAVRRAICDQYGVRLVTVTDPERDREPVDDGGYIRAVADWHEARVAAYRAVIAQQGDSAAVVGFLVWGDPSLYDSTIRIVECLGQDFEVLPGISAPQLLAARHRIVLHSPGQSVHLTTARRMRADIEAGQQNLIVLLDQGEDLAAFPEWQIWWGANLGTASEELVAGRVGEVRENLNEARARAKAKAGWVMDLYLLRAP